jgi:hypothetical protein
MRSPIRHVVAFPVSVRDLAIDSARSHGQCSKHGMSWVQTARATSGGPGFRLLASLLVGCSAAGSPHPEPTGPATLSAQGKPPQSAAPNVSRQAAVEPVLAASSNAASPGAHAAPPMPAQATHFECSANAVGMRVDARFMNAFSVTFWEGHALEKTSEVLIHYSLARLDAPTGLRRFQIVLTDHNGAEIAFGEDLWRQAFARGWVGVDIPFVVAQHRTGWCIEGRKRCPARDLAERELAQSQGEMASSVLAPRWVEQQLQGRSSDGTLELELPDDLAHRLGFPTRKHVKLAQVGTGIPARFALSQNLRTNMPDVNIDYGGSLARFVGEGPHLASVTVDASCSIRAVEASVERVIAPVPNEVRNFNTSSTARWQFSDGPR